MVSSFLPLSTAGDLPTTISLAQGNRKIEKNLISRTFFRALPTPEFVVSILRLCGQGIYAVLFAPPHVEQQPDAEQAKNPDKRPGSSRPTRQRSRHPEVESPLRESSPQRCLLFEVTEDAQPRRRKHHRNEPLQTHKLSRREPRESGQMCCPS